MPRRKTDKEEDESQEEGDDLMAHLEAIEKSQREILKALKDLAQVMQSDKTDEINERLSVIENIPLLQSHIRAQHNVVASE